MIKVDISIAQFETSHDLGDLPGSGSLLHGEDFKPTNLEDIIYSLEVREKDEVPELATFVVHCLMLDPDLRPPASNFFGEVLHLD